MVLHQSIRTNQLDSNGLTSNHKNKPAGLQWFDIQAWEQTSWTPNGLTSKLKNKPAGLQRFGIQA